MLDLASQLASLIDKFPSPRLVAHQSQRSQSGKRDMDFFV